MIKTNNKEEYFFIKRINLKYNRYYTANIRLHTKKKILEAYRLQLKITELDKLLTQSKIIGGRNNAWLEGYNNWFNNYHNSFCFVVVDLVDCGLL